jgi:hypothetical protein
MKRHPTTVGTATTQVKVKRVRKCVRNSRFEREVSPRCVETWQESGRDRVDDARRRRQGGVSLG